MNDKIIKILQGRCSLKDKESPIQIILGKDIEKIHIAKVAENRHESYRFLWLNPNHLTAKTKTQNRQVTGTR